MLFSRSSFIGGLILTAVGVVFLVDNFTAVDVWSQIWRFWPLILIGVGIDILYKYMRRRRVGVEVVEDSSQDEVSSMVIYKDRLWKLLILIDSF